jgi:hypothetical protein
MDPTNNTWAEVGDLPLQDEVDPNETLRSNGEVPIVGDEDVTMRHDTIENGDSTQSYRQDEIMVLSSTDEEGNETLTQDASYSEEANEEEDAIDQLQLHMSEGDFFPHTSDDQLAFHLKSEEEQQEITAEMEDLLEKVPGLKEDYQLIDRLGTGSSISITFFHDGSRLPPRHLLFRLQGNRS